MKRIKVIPQPVTIAGIQIAEVYEIKLSNIVIRELGVRAQIYHDLIDGERENIGSRDIVLDGELYDNWGIDDMYIVNVLLDLYSLELRPDDWVEPDGAEPPYSTNDKVSHNGEFWISLVDENVTEPSTENEEWEIYVS